MGVECQSKNIEKMTLFEVKTTPSLYPYSEFSKDSHIDPNSCGVMALLFI